MPKKRPPFPKVKRPGPSGEVPYKPFAGLKSMRDELAEAAAQSDGKSPPPARLPPSAPAALPDRDEEALALHRMMSGVTPLGQGPLRVPRSQASVERGPSPRASVDREKADADAVHEHLQALVESARFEVSDDGQRVEGRRVDLPPEALRKLRHGIFPVDARIDLHGMRAAEAREALERFLADKRARGERCVVVIHGKGEHSPRGQGVLRGEIGAWLSQGRVSMHVAAFATATQAEGGEGAVCVLLAR